MKKSPIIEVPFSETDGHIYQFFINQKIVTKIGMDLLFRFPNGQIKEVFTILDTHSMGDISPILGPYEKKALFSQDTINKIHSQNEYHTRRQKDDFKMTFNSNAKEIVENHFQTTPYNKESLFHDVFNDFEEIDISYPETQIQPQKSDIPNLIESSQTLDQGIILTNENVQKYEGCSMIQNKDETLYQEDKSDFLSEKNESNENETIGQEEEEEEEEEVTPKEDEIFTKDDEKDISIQEKNISNVEMKECSGDQINETEDISVNKQITSSDYIIGKMDESNEYTPDLSKDASTTASSSDDEEVEYPEFFDKKLLSCSDYDEILDIYNIRLTKSDLERCSEGRWFNDNIIDFNLNLINQKYENMKNVLIFNSAIGLLLLTKYKNQTEFSKFVTRFPKERIFDGDHIHVPMILNTGNHWIFCAFMQDEAYPQKKYLLVFDSLSNGSSKSYNLDHITRYFKERFLFERNEEAPFTIEIKNHTASQQENGSDCGPYALMNLEHFITISDKKWEFGKICVNRNITPEDAKKKRSELKESIISHIGKNVGFDEKVIEKNKEEFEKSIFSTNVENQVPKMETKPSLKDVIFNTHKSNDGSLTNETLDILEKKERERDLEKMQNEEMKFKTDSQETNPPNLNDIIFNTHKSNDIQLPNKKLIETLDMYDRLEKEEKERDLKKMQNEENEFKTILEETKTSKFDDVENKIETFETLDQIEKEKEKSVREKRKREDEISYKGTTLISILKYLLYSDTDLTATQIFDIIIKKKLKSMDGKTPVNTIVSTLIKGEKQGFFARGYCSCISACKETHWGLSDKEKKNQDARSGSPNEILAKDVTKDNMMAFIKNMDMREIKVLSHHIQDIVNAFDPKDLSTLQISTAFVETSKKQHLFNSTALSGGLLLKYISINGITDDREWTCDIIQILNICQPKKKTVTTSNYKIYGPRAIFAWYFMKNTGGTLYPHLFPFEIFRGCPWNQTIFKEFDYLSELKSGKRVEVNK